MDDYATFQNNPLTPQKIKRWAIIGVAVIVALVVLTFIRRTASLRVINLYPNPATSMAPLTPFLKVTFNKELSSKNLSVTSDSKLVQSAKVDGKTLIITLTAPNNAMDPSQNYKITIAHLESTDGKKFGGKAYSFSPQQTDATNLPVDQQQAILRQTTDPLISVADIDFSGTDEIFRDDSLVRLQSSQGIEEAFFHFYPFAHTITIDTHGVTRTPPDSDNTTITFAATINGNKKYKAKVDHTGTTEHLYLYDSENKQVFDSKSIDLSQFGTSRAL